MRTTTLLLALGLGADTPPELGTVEWGRKLEPALELAARTDRPVMLLFQEIPG
jgi:hypothetical protein